MADPAKFKSVSVSIATYKVLKYLGDGKITDADLTVSKTIESLAKKEGKKQRKRYLNRGQAQQARKPISQQAQEPTSQKANVPGSQQAS